jgi:hypothetical protein
MIKNNLVHIKCIDWKQSDLWECNRRIEEVTNWLEEHVGCRWEDWNWGKFGVITMPDNEFAIIFKLKFGVK